jgi:hypothetical protein
MMRYTSVMLIAVCGLLILGVEGYFTPAHAEKTFDVRGLAGACRLTNGVLTIHNNGRVSLKAQVASTNNGSDAYCLTFKFQDGNGTQVFDRARDSAKACLGMRQLRGDFVSRSQGEGMPYFPSMR